MADLSSLKDLGTTEQAAAPAHVRKVDSLGRSYATGKRKNAVARVWVKPGSGKIVVNTREFEVYFARPVLRMILRQPLVVTGRETQFDVVATVVGGAEVGRRAAGVDRGRGEGGEGHARRPQGVGDGLATRPAVRAAPHHEHDRAGDGGQRQHPGIHGCETSGNSR